MSDLVERLRKRAEIRSQIATRKSVQEGKPDRIAELLLEAADALAEVMAERDQLRREAEALRDILREVQRQDTLSSTAAEQQVLRQRWTEALAAHPEPALTADEVVRLHEEGTELRKEIERRLAPMKQGPFEPPEPK